MSSTIRILHLEDDPADGALVEARLRAEGVVCVIQRVENRGDFETAIQSGKWDVVFADYKLPSYDGVSALEHAQRVAPEIPFIVVSGTLGEDAAIDCLTKGATDYVTKQKLSRLTPVVRRALHEVDDRRLRRKNEQEIALLSFALNNVRESAFLIDAEGRFEFVNEEACRSLGYSRAELLDMSVPEVDLDMPKQHWGTHWEELRTKRSLTFEGRHRTRDGEELSVEINANYLEYGGRPFDLALVRDITERKRAQEAVQKLSHVVDQSPVSVIVTDTEGAINYVNPKFCEVTGYSCDEVLGKNPRILKSGTLAEEVYVDLWRTLAARQDWRGELCNKRKDGSVYWELAVISPMVDSGGNVTNYIAVKEDITVRKRLENEMRASLHEKEVLLKEIHHRVKNNLQIISSLLELEAGRHRDGTVRDAFVESHRRVRTMALVHEQLYASTDLAQIDFGHHLTKIANELRSTYGRLGVTLACTVEPLSISVDLAIPCGLIVNELITNALKHAFVNRADGTIRVSLRQVDQRYIEVVIGDDGMGLPSEQELRSRSSMGMRLVGTLVDQLGAELKTERAGGTVFTLTIPVAE
jgi:PAS domain S-box-containing protein